MCSVLFTFNVRRQYVISESAGRLSLHRCRLLLEIIRGKTTVLSSIHRFRDSFPLSYDPHFLAVS